MKPETILENEEHGQVRRHSSVTVCLGLTVFAGAFLRLVDLGRKGLWYDEFNWLDWICEPSWAQAIMSVPPPHASLFPALLWPFGFMFESDYFVRVLPALFGIATIPMVFVLGRRMFGTGAGLWAAAFLAVCPIHVDFCRQLEPYPLLVLNITIAAYFLVGVGEGKGLWRCVFAAVFIALTIYSHIFGVVSLGLFTLGLCSELFTSRRSFRKLLALTASWIFGIALYLPWLLYGLLSKKMGSITHDAIKANSDETISYFGRFISHACTAWVGSLGVDSTITGFILVAIAVLIAGVVLSIRRYPVQKIVSVTLWIVAGVVLFSFCHFWGYPPYGRYMMGVIPGVVLLLGLGASRLLTVSEGSDTVRRVSRGLGVASLLIIVVWSLGVNADRFFAPPIEDWRSLMSFLKQEVKKEDVIAMNFDSQNARDMFTRYAPRLLEQELVQESRKTPYKKTAKLLESGKRVWYMSKHGVPKMPQGWLDAGTFDFVQIGGSAFAVCLVPRNVNTPDSMTWKTELYNAALPHFRDYPLPILMGLASTGKDEDGNPTPQAKSYYDWAASELEGRRSFNPNSVRLHMKLALIYRSSGRLADEVQEWQAIDRLTRARGGQVPWMARAYKSSLVKLAKEQAANGEPFKAIDSYMRAYKVMNKTEIHWWLKAAKIYEQSVGPARGIREYRAIIAREPSYAPAHFNLGKCYEAQGKLEKAYSEFAKAADLDKDNDSYRSMRDKYQSSTDDES